MSKPTIPEVYPLVLEWYEMINQGYDGILFHCILDDGNYEQKFADSSLAQAIKTGDKFSINLAEKIAAMSNTQRRKLSAML